jgi:hypothetical protein
MADPKTPTPKQPDQFARLTAQIESLRSRGAQELARQLSPERRQQVVDALRDAVNKLRGSKK